MSNLSSYKTVLSIFNFIKMAQILLGFNAVLAFVLELVLFYSVGSYGFSLGKTSVARWLFAIFFASIAITLWGVWGAPKSEYRLGSPWRYIFELIMFLTGAFCLFNLNYTNWAVIFAVLVITNVGISFILKQ